MHVQRNLLLAGLGLACAMFLLPFFVNEHLRYVYRATVAHYIAKVSSPSVVLIGDSLAASARDWQLTLGAFRFSVINLASNGATTFQTIGMVNEAIAYRPRQLISFAGTNDFCNPNFNEKDYRRDLAALADALSKAVHANGVERVAFVVPPPTKSETCNRVRDRMRTHIIDLMARSGVAVVDIGPCVTNFGVLADRYTTDGVHLNGLAYALLDRALRAMEGGASDRGCADAIMRSNAALRTGMDMR